MVLSRGGGTIGKDLDKLRDFLAGGKEGALLEAAEGALLGGGGGGGRGLLHCVTCVTLL